MSERPYPAAVSAHVQPAVLHVIGQMVRGGAERQLVLVSAALAQRGWRQTVVSLNPGDVWEEHLREQGIAVVGVPRSGAKPWRLWQLGQHVRAARPDIVHSWSLHTNLYCRWLPGFPAGRKVFSLRRDVTRDRHTGRGLGRPHHLSVWKHCGCVVSNSARALERLQAHGATTARAAVVGNVVVARGRAEPGQACGEPHVVAAGDLIPLKAYDVLVDALGSLADSGHAFRLSLAGVGPERSALERLAVERGIGGRVQFLGSVDDVPALMAAAHLLVHPSRSEGLSNTVLEAMGEGLPVVATPVGAIPEYVIDGRTGLLVPPGRADGLAAAISRLLTAPGLRAELGGAALRLVRERCDPSVVAGQYEAVYRELLAGCPPRRVARDELQPGAAER